MGFLSSHLIDRLSHLRKMGKSRSNPHRRLLDADPPSPRSRDPYVLPGSKNASRATSTVGVGNFAVEIRLADMSPAAVETWTSTFPEVQPAVRSIALRLNNLLSRTSPTKSPHDTLLKVVQQLSTMTLPDKDEDPKAFEEDVGNFGHEAVKHSEWDTVLERAGSLGSDPRFGMQMLAALGRVATIQHRMDPNPRLETNWGLVCLTTKVVPALNKYLDKIATAQTQSTGDGADPSTPAADPPGAQAPAVSGRGRGKSAKATRGGATGVGPDAQMDHASGVEQGSSSNGPRRTTASRETQPAQEDGGGPGPSKKARKADPAPAPARSARKRGGRRG